MNSEESNLETFEVTACEIDPVNVAVDNVVNKSSNTYKNGQRPKPKLILTKEEKNDLRRAFNLLDYEGVGKINADDFRVAIKALGFEPSKDELNAMVNGVDPSGSGRLSFENFLTAMMRKVASRDTEDEMMKSFRLFDEDDNGFITFENIKRVTEILGTYLTDEEIDEMIDDADKDLDGRVSVEEYIKLMKKTVNLVTP